MFLDKFSFLSIGILLRALKRAFGSTRVECDEKLLALRLSSSRQWKNDMSVGSVLRLFEPRFRICSSGRWPKSCRSPGGI